MNLLAHGVGEHGVTASSGTAVAMCVVASIGVTYVILAGRCGREPGGWNHWRTASFVAGIALLLLALKPSASEDFGDHMLGHLLLGMFAPLALVLAAPITLILRTVRPRTGRRIVRVLRSAPSRALTNPVLVLSANLGGLAVLYFTPLYSATTTNMVLHEIVHAHFFFTGYLFAWMIAGPDPGPHRPSVPVRLIVLGVAVLGHSVIAQLLYAGLFVEAPLTPEELQDGGTLMYYWGDIAEILLALAMLLTWRPTAHKTVASRLNRHHVTEVLGSTVCR